MANMHLVTGYAGREHVTAADQGAFHSAFLGSGEFVFGTGNQFAASIISNNQVRVLDGDIYMQGRFVRHDESTYVDLVIENGTQGQYRNDLIVARYTKNVATTIEEVNLVVIKGEPTTSNPADPAYTTGDILVAGDILHDMPLYRVVIHGVNLTEVVPLFVLHDAEKSKSNSDDVIHLFDASTGIREKIKVKNLGISSNQINEGVLPVERGGTGASDKMDAVESLGAMRHDMFQRIASYETAGVFEWTAPDLCKGRTFKIGVFLIGAGASGGAYWSNSSSYRYANAGSCGSTATINMVVEPGQKIAIVVGAGGESVIATESSCWVGGKNGGSSSFGGITVDGGNGGSSGSDANASDGSFAPLYTQADPFSNIQIIGTGGGAVCDDKVSGCVSYKGGKSPVTRKGGGDGVGGCETDVVAEPGTSPGSSGGGAAAFYGNATSGAGADGAVYIYFLGAVEE